MTDDELANKLKEITRELRDLKTAHERGLGTTRFYRYEIEIMAQAGSYYNFIARVADDEPQSPVIIPAMQTEAPLGAIAPYCYFFSIISGEYRLLVYNSTPNDGYLKVAVISSSQLKEFRQA